MTTPRIVTSLQTGLAYYPRAKVCTETWLNNDLSPYYIHSSTPCDYLPITIVPGAGEGYPSATPKRLGGLKQMISDHPDAEWFYQASCDNYVFTKRLMALLDELGTTSEPMYVGGDVCGHLSVGSQRLTYASGGATYLLNNAAAHLLAPELDTLMSQLPEHPFEDALVGWKLQALGVKPTLYSDKFYGCNPFRGHCGNHGAAPRKGIVNPISFHYLSADEIQRVHTGGSEWQQ